MKKLLSLPIALAFCLTSYGQWINQISGTSEDLNAVQFVNSNIGFAVGNNGTILKTVDSGLNWNSLNSNVTIPFSSIFFIDDDTGFVSGSYYNQDLSANQGVLLKTIDGGINWIDLNFPFEDNLSDIFFLNSSIGFASCLTDGIFRTLDGGLNWTNVSSLFTHSTFFSSQLIGYSLCNNGICKTIDGGLNWIQIKDNDSPDYNNANILESLFFTSDTTGFFASRYYCGIYSTNDGGLNLDFICTATVSIHFPSANIGYAITEPDGIKIDQTTDSGSSWSNIYQSNSQLNDIYFTNDSTGWAVGEQGTILYTNNDVVLDINNIDELDNQVLIYPNPSNNLITIDSERNLTILKMNLYNNLGKLIFDYKPAQKIINLDNFQKGLYILKLETNKGIISKKIIKK